MTMKREEAIEVLELQISNAEFYARYTNNDKDAEKELKDAEAFRMAKEALQAQSTHGRLIDADVLIDDFNKLNEWLDIDEAAEIVSLINNAPTISAKAVQGKWVRCEGEIKDLEGNILCHVYWYECDQCRSRPPRKQFEKQEWLSDFCPNCGAKMNKGGGNNEVD